MEMSAPSQITQILSGLSRDDPEAAAKLLPLVYEELRALAHQRVKNEPPALTLQATALVHEAYLRLVADEEVCWENRGHFFAAAAEAMRRILIERARRYQRQKHGGGRQRLDLDEAAEGLHVLGIPATRLAEDLGRRIVANVVMLGFVAAMTDVTSPEAMKKAVLDSVPKGTEELNERAFETGFEYGQKRKA